MLALFFSVALADTWPPDAVIPKAATLDVTPEGFAAVAAVIPALVPTGIEIPDTSSGGTVLGLCDYGFSLSNGAANIQVVSATIVPQNGVLDVTAELLVGINEVTNQLSLNYEYCFGDDTCNGYIDPFPVTIHTTINLEVIGADSGQPQLDATIGALEYEYGLSGDDIHLDCWLQGIEDFLDIIGLSLYDLIIGLIAPNLESTIADLAPTLEETVEEAFSAAIIQQELELNGATVSVNLYPSDVDITTDGMRIVMDGGLSAAQASCIAQYDPGGSLKTLSAPPDISANAPGAHAALHLSDDFTNEALYALWRGGLLCIDSNSIELPISLDTTLLGSLTGNVFSELFPTSKPVVLRTVPAAPLSSAFDGPNDVDIVVQDLQLEFYGELDGRLARLVDISLAGNIGANLIFDATTGNLGVELALAADSLTPSVVYNELKPDENETILASFGPSFGSLVTNLIGSLLGDSLSFALPSFSGFGLQSLSVNGEPEWLDGYVQLGLVSYGDPTAGCGSCGDTGGGCSGGCTVGGVFMPTWMAWLPALGALVLRRRQR